MTIDIDSSARLLHEAIQQLGWSADPSRLVDRVRRLDFGLPAEDEFMHLLCWLGKCTLIHKLDQGQFPIASKASYQVPDLLASFDTEAGPKVVLIEVKVSNKNKLVWKPDYLHRLKQYSSLLSLPLLIAWKFHCWWFLVDIECFVIAKTNYHLKIETAGKNNLLSCLAGDFGYVMKPNVGLHFIMRMKHLIGKTEEEGKGQVEHWTAKIQEAYFTDSSGRKSTHLPSGLWPLFIASGPERCDREEGNLAHHSYVISGDQGMVFAHGALPVLINFQQKDDKVHWRKQLIEHKYPVGIDQFYQASQEGIKENFVQYVLHIRPSKLPAFLT